VHAAGAPLRLPASATRECRARIAPDPSMGDDGETMTAFLVLLIPLLLMVFALFMERVEKRLKTSTVSEADVQEFLDTARPEEVNTLILEGWTKAFAKFRLRRRPRFRRKNKD
jgi:hypothetical protein